MPTLTQIEKVVPAWFETGSLSFAISASLIAAVPTAVIAFLVYRISRSQRDIAAAKLRLDLFEKRYEIFDAVWTFLSRVIQPGTEGLNALFEDKFSLRNAMPKARFLLGKDVEDYLRTINAKFVDLMIIDQETRRDGNTVPHERIQERTDLERWFWQEAQDGCRAVFDPYLDFSSWRAA